MAMETFTHSCHHIILVGYWIWISQTVQPTSNEIEYVKEGKKWFDCSCMWKWWEVPSTAENEKKKCERAKETKLIQIDCFCCCCSFLVYILFNAHTISDSSIVWSCWNEPDAVNCAQLKKLWEKLVVFFSQWNFSLSIHLFVSIISLDCCLQWVQSLLLSVCSGNARILGVKLRIIKWNL